MSNREIILKLIDKALQSQNTYDDYPLIAYAVKGNGRRKGDYGYFCNESAEHMIGQGRRYKHLMHLLIMIKKELENVAAKMDT
jgi:hypothetical protein